MTKLIIMIAVSSILTLKAEAAIFPSEGLCIENFEYQGEQLEIETVFTYGFLNSFKGVSVSYVLDGEMVELSDENGLSCVTGDSDYTHCTVDDETNPIIESVGAGFPWGASINLKDEKDYVNFFDSCEKI